MAKKLNKADRINKQKRKAREAEKRANRKNEYKSE